MSADPLPDPNANDGHAKCRDETRLARDLAGHRIREIHDCFLMNCRDLGDEVRSLYERLALPLASETTEDITTPEGYRAQYDDITQRPLASETTDADPETYRRGWIAGHKQGCLDTLAPPLASETTDAGPPEGADREALWAKFTAGEKLAYGCGYRDAKAEPVLDENLGRVRVYGYGLIDIGDALAFAKLHGWRLSESVG